jgi:hypothetical protein
VSDDTRKPAAGFVSLKSVKQGPPDAAAALAEIRQIYFRTSRHTIDNDFAHAIELLKSLPDDESRIKAHVFMEGLAEMRKQWSKKRAAATTTKRSSDARRRGRHPGERKGSRGED